MICRDGYQRLVLTSLYAGEEGRGGGVVHKGWE